MSQILVMTATCTSLGNKGIFFVLSRVAKCQRCINGCTSGAASSPGLSSGPPPVMSLGPEPVTDDVRAEERARRQAEEPRVVSGQKTVAPKKRKVIPQELEERQKRASARMLELGVPPLQARMLLVVVCLIKTCHLCNYLLYISMYCLIFLSTYETYFPLQCLFIHILLMFSGKGS